MSKIIQIVPVLDATAKGLMILFCLTDSGDIAVKRFNVDNLPIEGAEESFLPINDANGI